MVMEKFWKMKKKSVQGKIREFYFQSGKFKKEKKTLKSMKKSGNF